MRSFLRRPGRRSGRPAAAAVSTALLLALTACGGDGGDQATDEPSVEAGEEPGEEAEEGGEVEPSEFVDQMMAGLENSTTAKMTMTMDAAGAGMEAEGELDYSTEPVSMSMTMTNAMLGNEPMDLRLVDGVMYMNMGAMSNNKFIAYDLSDAENLPPGMDQLGGQMDPLAAFEEFEPALKSVTFVGDEEVDGEELAHYDIVLDPSKMDSMEGLPAEAGVPEEIGYDLYFDDEWRIRQMTMSLDAAQPVELEVKMFEWGEPVEIVAPPAADVVDPSTMQG